MTCPKCGHENEETRHECESCGIFFIRWMIQRHRKARSPRGEDPAKPSPLFRIPSQFSRSTLAFVFFLGCAFGVFFGRLIPDPPPTPWRSYAAVKVPGGLAERHAAGILSEAKRKAKGAGAVLAPAGILGYFAQGVNSFTLENLRAAAEAAGEGPESVEISEGAYFKKQATPFKCLIEGSWSFMKARRKIDFRKRPKSPPRVPPSPIRVPRRPGSRQREA